MGAKQNAMEKLEGNSISIRTHTIHAEEIQYLSTMRLWIQYILSRCPGYAESGLMKC